MQQARLVMAAIRQHHPELQLELVTMKTTGDRILDRPLDAIGGKGLFIKELDEALESGRVDICVHSYKDVPVPDNPRLPLIATSAREIPTDVLVLPAGANAPDPTKPIGTSSLRRQRQLADLFPGCQCQSIRGNVETRLRKLDTGEYGALVLAAAGVKRLGLWHRVNRVFRPEEMLPAAGQGALAVQGRAGENHDYLQQFHHQETADAVAAERAFVEGLGADCASPVAAYAAIDGSELRLRVWYVDENNTVRTGSRTCQRTQARQTGFELAEALKREGGPCRKGL